MIMLVDKERYSWLAQLSEDTGEIAQKDLDATKMVPSCFYAFVLSKETLKEGSTETEIQSMLSDSYNVFKEKIVGPIESDTKKNHLPLRVRQTIDDEKDNGSQSEDQPHHQHQYKPPCQCPP